MKFFFAFTLSVVIVATTFDSTLGLAKYLDELPNSKKFTQKLGHPNEGSLKLSEFASAFAAAGHSWTAAFCKLTFPGSSMENGAAFGDPCCTWKKGGVPDFTVVAFTTTPNEATVCASNSTGQTSHDSYGGGSLTSNNDSYKAGTLMPKTINASATMEAPFTTTNASLPTDVLASTDALATTDAPDTTGAAATTPAPLSAFTPSAGGCGVKGSGGKRHSKSSYSFRH